MKKLLTFASCLLLSFAANKAGATYTTWDPQGTTGGTVTSPTSGGYTGSMSQTWENAKWSTSQTGQATPQNWVENTAALFACQANGNTPAFTVTMNANHTVAGFFDGPQTPDPCTLTVTGTGTIILPGAQGFDITTDTGDAGSLTINNVIADGSTPGQIVWEGNGSLILNGANTYSGGFSIGNGTIGIGGVSFGNSAAFGTGTITWDIQGFIQPAAGATAYNIANPMTLIAGNLTFAGNTGGTTFSGPWTFPASGTTALFNIAANITVSGAMGGGAVIQMTNRSSVSPLPSWTFTGVNTYTGNTVISNGQLTIGGAGQLGSGNYAGKIIIGAAASTVTYPSAFVYSSSASQTLNGVISGSGPLTNNGTGELILSGANTYTNLTVVNGASGCILQIGDGSANSGAVPGGIAVASSAQLIFAPAPGGTLTYNATAQVISGTGSLTVNGPGTLIIGGGHNTYTGSTVINGGILQTGGDATTGGKAANLGTTPNSFVANNIILNGGTLQGNNENFAFMANRGITLTANSGLSCITNGNALPPLQGEMGIQGVITDTSSGNGGAGSPSGITITGQTNLTTGVVSGVYLEGINTYYGPTVVQSGILSLYYNGSINNSSYLSINSGAAFDVSSNSTASWVLNQPLYANGSGIGGPGYLTLAGNPAAVMIGFNGGNINFQNEPLSLTITPATFTGDGAHPALYVSQGSLLLNGNSVTVTNSTGTPLGYGVYTLIQLASGYSISGAVPSLSGGVGGAGIVGGATATLVISANGQALNLMVAPPSGTVTATFNNMVLTPSTFVYNMMPTSVTVSGTVSNTSSGVALTGDTVTVSIGSFGTASTTTFDAAGDFTVTVPLTGSTPAGFIPVGSYAVSCTFTGTQSGLSAQPDTSDTLVITPAQLVVTVSAQNKLYNGTTAVTYTLSTNANGDIVTVVLQPSPATGSAAFATPNIGNNITVTVGWLEITGGANSANWYLPSEYTITTTANITTTSQTWDGNDYANSHDWSDATNWLSTTAPDLAGDSLDFTGSQGPEPLMQASYTVWELTFDSAAGIGFNITNTGVSGAGTLSVGMGGVTNESAYTQTFSVPVANLTSFSSQWYVTGGSSLVMNSNVSDAGGGITLNGAGILNLAGSNNAVTGPLTNLAGTIEITGAAKLNNGSYAGAINNNNSLIFNSISNQTFSGIISGSGSLTDNGTGSLTLGNANTYSGSTSIGNSSLIIGADASFGTPPGSFLANSISMNCNINPSAGTFNDYGIRDTGFTGTLNATRGITLGPLGGSINVQGGVTLTVAGAISGSGPFYASPTNSAGYGTIILTAANTYTGATYVGAGTLTLGTGGSLPAGSPLNISPTDQGTGNFSTFNLNGATQTIGPLATFNMGATAQLLGPPTLTLGTGGALTILETNVNTSFTGAITGTSGTITVTGVGGTGTELTLTGTNTYTGATTISGGAKLGLATKGSISNSTSIILGAGGTFDPSGLTATTYFLSASQTLTASGTGAAPATIKGASGGVVNVGAQAITLNYAPTTFTGDASDPALTISQGTLSVNGNAITVVQNTGNNLLTNGVYVLVQTPNPITVVAAPTLSGSSTLNLGVGGSAVLSVSGNNIILTVSGVVTGPPPSPHITTVGFSAPGVLSFTVTNGTAGGPYRLMETTNLAIPVTNWNVVETGTFNGSGNLNITYTNNPSDTQEFFSIQNP